MTYIREREWLAVRGGWREEAVQSVSFKLWGTITWCVWGSGLPWRRADVALWAGSGRGEAEISFKKRTTKLQNCWKQQCGFCKLQSKSDSESLLFLLFLSALWEAVIYVMHLKTFCKPCLSPRHTHTQTNTNHSHKNMSYTALSFVFSQVSTTTIHFYKYWLVLRCFFPATGGQ